MGSNRVVEAGGIVLCVAGLVTAGYLTQDVNFGFILPILHVMNMAIGITAAGLVALAKPRFSPVAGVVAIGLALNTFVSTFHDPLWALPTVLGGLLCVAGPFTGRLALPRPQRG